MIRFPDPHTCVGIISGLALFAAAIMCWLGDLPAL